MTTDLSRPVWAIIPKLSAVQFPWRWLGITSMFGSILLAVSIPAWVAKLKADFRPRDLIVALGLLLSVYFIAGEVIWGAEYLKGQAFAAKFPVAAGSVSFKDWLPIWAKDVAQLKQIEGNVEAGSRSVIINSWEPERRAFQIASGPPTQARVRTYFYPHWTASSQGKILATGPAEDGALLISVPAEASSIDLEFREPRRVKLARIASVSGWLLILGLFACGPIKLMLSKLRNKPGNEVPW
jgi:hypothetical protein